MSGAQGIPPDLLDNSTERPLLPGTITVAVVGGPGSGKGTLCANLVSKHNFFHISTGDLLRSEAASGSEFGQQCRAIMAEGKLLPPRLGCQLVRNAMMQSTTSRFLLDGFPRSIDQAVAFEECVGPLDFCVYLDCSEAAMLERLAARGAAQNRADDLDMSTVNKRFVTFQTETAPLRDHFLQRDERKICTISTEADPDTVYSMALLHLAKALPDLTADLPSNPPPPPPPPHTHRGRGR